ncbi:TRAP-type C4-dicarboxylate transport system, substrate-binding protein [Alteribacillus persepolensis]|uniref:TRAP-type C4-dicarboxylate transport system, substrate-binding protein n=1 Tax=Alteribacillus persepolensis TaxID=568899 RepID=A0A1G8K431_9BACI|nr:TRAP transporter substrate-binding protein DctP [Alteribacillus persepolensis]SDI38246.1 TRAP-type C4-dicarboxylate transport system, substrate-binding protein [Alteribacillus persepolensis]
MKKRFHIGFVLLFTMILAAGCGAEETSEMTDADSNNKAGENFRIVSFLPADHSFTEGIVPIWINKMEEATDGAVTFEWIGGPESIPLEEQFDAVVNGTVEVGFNVSSYYGHLMPETHSLNLSPFTPEEERENGYFDYLQEKFNEQNVEYTGRWLGPSPYYLWTNEKIESLDELKGQRMRSNPTYDGILQRLGVNPVTVSPSDVYTSLERNMVDGFGFPLLGPNDSGWTEVTEYIIDEPFLNQNGTILFNKQAFDSLSPEIQNKLHEANAEFEYEMVEHFKEKNEKEWETILDAGVEKITLSEEESKKFQGFVEDAFWEKLEDEAPEEVDTLRELFESE